MLRSSFLVLLAAVCAASAFAQDASVPPAQLLRSALDYTRSAKGMRVKAAVEGEGKQTNLEAQIAGKDFDLQVTPGMKRVRSVGAKNWTSEDGGKTWQASPTREITQLQLLLGPLDLKGPLEVEKAGEETSSNGKDKETLVLLKVKSGNATAEYWIGLSLIHI